VKTLDNQININIIKIAIISELKINKRILNIPLIEQRLIYHGKYCKIMQRNSEKIKNYKIENESIIRLVIRKLTFQMI